MSPLLLLWIADVDAGIQRTEYENITFPMTRAKPIVSPRIPYYDLPPEGFRVPDAVFSLPLALQDSLPAASWFTELEANRTSMMAYCSSAPPAVCTTSY